MIKPIVLGILATTFSVLNAQDAPAKEAASEQAPAAPKLEPAQIKNDSSYALGFRTGATFEQQFGRFGITADDIDSAVFIKGFMAALKSATPEFSEEQLQAGMQALGDELQKRDQAQATANSEAEKTFLAENGKRKGVTTTKSGLQYEVLNAGGKEKYQAPKDGKTDNKQFLVNYRGTLIDGKQFDASPEGQTVPMTLQVIEGFKEALSTMPVGAKWKLFIPSALAYGAERRSALIGPNTTLIFELELVKIEDAPEQPSQMDLQKMIQEQMAAKGQEQGGAPEAAPAEKK